MSVEQKIERLERLKKALEEPATLEETQQIIAALIEEYLADLREIML